MWARPFNGSMRNKQCIDYYFSVLILCHLLDTKIWIIYNFSNKQPWMNSYACVPIYLWKKKHNCQWTNNNHKIEIVKSIQSSWCELTWRPHAHCYMKQFSTLTNYMACWKQIIWIFLISYLWIVLFNIWTITFSAKPGKKQIPKHLW